MTENTNTSSRTAPTAAEIFAELQQIRQDTQHLSLALEKLEKVPADNNADEKICQAKIDAIEEVVVQRRKPIVLSLRCMKSCTMRSVKETQH